MRAKILVSDFDGTMTRRDFYQLILERLPAGRHDFWGDYLAGRITHFEALASVFAAYPVGEEGLMALAREMGLNPDLRKDVEALQTHGWTVEVASAGCAWYIQRLLEGSGLTEIFANPGRIDGDRLVMELPHGSPYFSPQTGIDKSLVVRKAIESGADVAFAGDGPPDLAPALLVPPDRRYATGFLADALRKSGEKFHRFDRWSEVAACLLGSSENECLPS